MMQLKPTSLRAPASVTRVILVRHGRSTLNEQGCYQGSSDESVLTEPGWQAAVQTGQVLGKVRLDAVYASPLRRVQETVAAMQRTIASHSLEDRASPPAIYIDPALREIDIPGWEGLPFAEVRQRFAIDYQCWKQRPHEFQMRRAGAAHFFPVRELYERAAQFWQRTLPRHRGQTILIVGHGGTNHALLSTAIGLAPRHHHTLQQSNCGISILDFPDSQPAQLRSLNATHHLNETLPKLKEGKRGFRMLLLPLDPDGNYPGTAIQQVANQLQAAAIDLSVNARFSQAEQAIGSILGDHPRTLRFETFTADFLQSWQQALAARTVDSDQLITALAITDPQQIQRLIAAAIGLAADQSHRIQLKPGSLSILHYSSIHHLPVLQSLNFNAPIASLQEVFA